MPIICRDLAWSVKEWAEFVLNKNSILNDPGKGRYRPVVIDS